MKRLWPALVALGIIGLLIALFWPPAEPISVLEAPRSGRENPPAQVKPQIPDAPAAGPAESPAHLDFRELARTTLSALPTRAQLQKLSDAEVHRTPVMLLRAGQSLGKVAEAIAADPELTPQGLKFYSDCALDEKVSGSVRALCYGNWKKLSRDGKNPPAVPADIRALADKLED